MLRDPSTRRILIVATACLLASACAQQGHFPSLLPRPIEKLDRPGEQAPEPAPPPVPQDPALRQQLAAVLDRARQGQQSFEKVLGEAQSAVARAGSAGSDSWIAAQVAVSRLEGARADTTAALADLDAMLLGRSHDGKPTNEADQEAIASTREQVQGLADSQAARIGELSSRLSG